MNRVSSLQKQKFRTMRESVNSVKSGMKWMLMMAANQLETSMKLSFHG